MKLDDLKPKQQKAILHLVDNPTVAAVARKMDMTEAQVWVWLKDPVFRNVLGAERELVFQEAMAKMKSSVTKATDTLAALMDSDDERIRMKAASDILDKTFKFREVVEFEKRISALEDQYRNEKRRGIGYD